MQFENKMFSLLNPSTKSFLAKISNKPPLQLESVGERRLKSTRYIPLIPAFSRKGEGANACIDPNAGAVRRAETKTPHLKARFSERILMIKPYPGLNYAHFNLENTDAVLHDLYHSGTACASTQWGENYSLLEFIKRCQKQNTKVYLAPAVKSADAYQSTRELIEQGAEMIWNMSIEAAYVKLMLAYGNFTDERQILAIIDRDIAGEHV
jgi:L-asparaginase/Glu-tRNA(Gln) amidotransferase subunit D